MKAILCGAFGVLMMVMTLSPAEAAEIEPAALSSCPSGSFCIWSSSGYGGQLHKYSTVGTAFTLSGRVGSFYNNRSKKARLYQNADGSGSTQCVPPGASDSSVTGWQVSARALWLGADVGC